jgi:hypothetical protein
MSSRAQLERLKARQIAFLRERLVSEQAEREWRERLPAAWALLLATPLGRVADAEALNRALDAALSARAASRAIRPAARVALSWLTAAARGDQARVREYVPGAARLKIDKLLERPSILPERLVREVLDSEAMDEVMHDVLSSALREFSQRVNPFVADWGLPALLKRLSPFGLGKGLESARAEFERRLEPEIGRFLRGFSSRARRDTTEALIARAGEPKFVALRQRVASWLIEQRVADLAGGLTAEDEALAQEIQLDVLEHNVSREAIASQRRAAVAAFVAAHRDRTVGEVLARYGIALEPDFDAITAATWPLVRTAWESAPVQAWLEALVMEFFDGLPDEPE